MAREKAANNKSAKIKAAELLAQIGNQPSPIDEETRKILSIQTYYESMWIERGLNIKYQKFALPREGELVEPDIEIPLDDYRSYRRDKRSSKDTAK